MDPMEVAQHLNRRHFLQRAGCSMGLAAMGLLGGLGSRRASAVEDRIMAAVPHFAPKAKRVIYMFQSGAPTQIELFDYKPGLKNIHMTELPDSIRMGQRLTGMTANQTSFPVVASKFGFSQFGQSGTWISELLPYTAGIVDDICLLRAVHTEAINHDPAITFFQTGNQQSGRPSMGAWLSYGLGSENENLPAFMVLTSRGKGNSQGLYAHLWGSGFLDSVHQGVMLRGGKNPVLYLKDPEGMSQMERRQMLDQIAALNQNNYEQMGDPETLARIQQYEMAYRMQTSVPELMDLKDESDYTVKLYGPDCLVPGTYAANCLLARRLAERGVRFIQLYHQGWDQHGNLPNEMGGQAKDVDQPSAALITDLKQRGLLEDTLVIWGGEFGRTVYCQGEFKADNYGRDHHPRCFSIFMAGGGVKPGITYGETDEFSYNIVKDPVHIHDFQATILNLMGIDHEKLIFKHQGRRYRLTDVSGKVVPGIIA